MFLPGFTVCSGLLLLYCCGTALTNLELQKAEELLFPPAKSLAVPVDFVLFLGEAFAIQNGTTCSYLYGQSLVNLFGPDVETAAVFKAHFSSFVLTSTLDNVTLNHWKMMARDYQCKMTLLRYNGTGENEQHTTQYCTYSVWPDGEYEDRANGTMYGFCLPSDCTRSEIIQLLPMLKNYVPFRSNQVQEELMCVPGYQPQPWWHHSSALCILSVTLLLTAVVILCTTLDLRHKKVERRDRDRSCTWWRHFSLIRSHERLCRDAANSMSISCLHGIKVITMALIILTHLICFMQAFLSNADDLISSYRGHFLAAFLYNGTYRVATFFVIGGTLFSYSMLGRTRKKGPQQHIGWKFCLITVINRYLRLVAVYAFVIALYVGLLPYLSHFPAWYVVDPFRQCSGKWWKNLLYINNLEHVQLCMPWTWYLASDFQLFLAHFPLVVLLLKKPKLASILTAVLLLCSCVLKAALVYVYDYPPSLMLLVPIEGYNQDVASYTFDIYMKPYGWWGSYLVGMYFGYILFSLKQYNLRPVYCHMAACMGLLLNVACLFSIYWTVQGWRSTVFDVAYVGLSPVLWGVGWVLLIGACYCNPSGWLNRLLAHPIWLPLSNLTYSSFLIHCIVVFSVLDWYAKSGINGPFLPAFSHLETASLFAMVLICTYISAGVLFYLVEAPSDSIRMWLMGRLAGEEQRNRCRGRSSEAVPLGRNESTKGDLNSPE